MKQDQSWKELLTERLKKKKDRRVDVFGNPLPTMYEQDNYPQAVQAWLKSREPFRRTHLKSEMIPCDGCVDSDLKCTFPKCAITP